MIWDVCLCQYCRLDREVIALTWGSDGAEEDCIVLFELVESAFGDVCSRFLVCLGAPVVVLEVQLEGFERDGQGL